MKELFFDAARFDAFRKTKRFGSLDGLRCLSVLAVLWHHSGLNVDCALFHRGQLGVHLFFAISGFLITSLLIRESEQYGEISLSKFYMRRSLRIFPLYYAVLLVYVIVVAVMEQGSSAGERFFGNLPAYATYTSNWFVDLVSNDRVIFYFAWSLAVEEQFYLTWPWIERFARPLTKMTLLFGLMGIVMANHFNLLHNILPADSVGHRILWSIAPCILFGVLIAHLIHTRSGFAALNALFGRYWSAPTTLLTVVVVASIEPGGQIWEYVVYLCLAALVVSCVIREDNGLSRMLHLRPLVRMGTVSYGIYLMHMLCFNASRILGAGIGVENAWALWISGVLMTYIVAELSFATFERYFQDRKSRLARS
ncbi:MAG: acyltransferase [Planctomycetota bacterium]